MLQSTSAVLVDSLEGAIFSYLELVMYLNSIQTGPWKGRKTCLYVPK